MADPWHSPPLSTPLSAPLPAPLSTPHAGIVPGPLSASIGQQTPTQGQAHTRTYQACIPCRRRKVRCDLGPVDNPHSPPCVRCRRESKECYFSATRRKRKLPGEADDDSMSRRRMSIDDEIDDEEALEDEEEFVARNAHKRARGPNQASIDEREYRRLPLRRGDPGLRPDRIQRTSVSEGTDQDQDHEEGEPDVEHRSEEAARVLTTTEVFSGHHALAMLYAAAQSGAAMSDDPDRRRRGRTAEQEEQATATVTDAPLTPEGETAALESWSRFRFVRQGWFTAREGMEYVRYFTEHLAPLSAVPVPDYSDPRTHEDLLTGEPMLAVTILTIASRYMPLTGAGARSRPHAIHEAVWKCLREMIDRLLWGQEQFGGGFCGAGAATVGSQPGCDVNPLGRTGLRTLGGVVSLVLLTEWHPRALHFPPGWDGESLMGADDVQKAGSGSSGAMASWLEPCWRSDRMCWMLLGMANSLAYEIGVYADRDDVDAALAAGEPPEKVMEYTRRRRHVRETLRIYFSQTAGRLGLTSMLPQAMLSARPLDPDMMSPVAIERGLRERLAKFRNEERISGANVNDGEGLTMEEVVGALPPGELVLHFWAALADLMEHGNEVMFPNRRRTRQLIKTQQYQALLQDRFHPMLVHWKAAFDAIAGGRIPARMQSVMLIEYEYARVYLNSLSLQAVVERCTHDSPPRPFAAPVLARDRPGPVPQADLMAWCGNDRPYVHEVTTACRETLRIALDLYPGGELRHAPVRTYFRVISVAIILLKTFVLGATEDEAVYSVTLLEKCTAAFRVCIVDDVHVSSRFADLCDALLRRIRSRFVRLSAARKGRRGRPRKGERRNGSAETEPVPGQTPNRMPGDGSFDPPTLQPVLSSGMPLWRIPGTNGGESDSAGSVVTNGQAVATNHYLSVGPRTGHEDGYAGPADGQPDFPAVSILPPPGLSLVYGEDEALVLGGHAGGSATESGSAAGSNFGLPSPVQQMASYGPSQPVERHLNGTGPEQIPASHGGDGPPGGHDGHGGGAGYEWPHWDQNWLVLPIDNILGSHGADVTQTGWGVEVGGMDMLDVLLPME